MKKKLGSLLIFATFLGYFSRTQAQTFNMEALDVTGR